MPDSVTEVQQRALSSPVTFVLRNDTRLNFNIALDQLL